MGENREVGRSGIPRSVCELTVISPVAFGLMDMENIFCQVEMQDYRGKTKGELTLQSWGNEKGKQWANGPDNKRNGSAGGGKGGRGGEEERSHIPLAQGYCPVHAATSLIFWKSFVSVNESRLVMSSSTELRLWRQNFISSHNRKNKKKWNR